MISQRNLQSNKKTYNRLIKPNQLLGMYTKQNRYINVMIEHMMALRACLCCNCAVQVFIMIPQNLKGDILGTVGSSP